MTSKFEMLGAVFHSITNLKAGFDTSQLMYAQEIT
jgi:hypothetical protein